MTVYIRQSDCDYDKDRDIIPVLSRTLEPSAALINLTDSTTLKNAEEGKETIVLAPFSFSRFPSRNFENFIQKMKAVEKPPARILGIACLGDQGPLSSAAHYVSFSVTLNPNDKEEADIHYLNPRGFASYAEDRVLIQTIRKIFPRGNTVTDYPVIQQDAHSCGPIAVNAVLTMAQNKTSAEGMELAVKIGRNPNVLRAYHAEILEGKDPKACMPLSMQHASPEHDPKEIRILGEESISR